MLLFLDTEELNAKKLKRRYYIWVMLKLEIYVGNTQAYKELTDAENNAPKHFRIYKYQF